MAYIGNTVENQGFTPAIDYFNGNGVTVTFTLSRPIASVAQVIVAVDNVIQNPSSSYTVAGNEITFSSAPLSGTNNIWVEYTSLITTYQGISQDPTVIGDIRATGGYLAEGDFGNSFVDGTILDYVTGNGRITVGDADGLTIYNGGTASRTALASWNSSGTLTNTGGAVIQGLTVGKGGGAVGTNTAIGIDALSLNTTGSQNTSIGYQALDVNTDGVFNTAVGASSLGANTSGNYNSALGRFALTTNTTGSDNTAIGMRALRLNTTGAYNTAVGDQALDANTTASNNTAVGYQAGYSITTGALNTFVGSQAGGISTVTGQRNVGVGDRALAEVTSGNNNIGFGFTDSVNGYAPVFNPATESNRVVMGHVAITNAYIKVAWTVTSDQRDKTNIVDLDKGLDFVQQLQPKQYQFRTSRTNEIPSGNVRYGFLAQDILALEGNSPVIVDNEDLNHLKYNGESLVPVLVKAIQELNAKVEAQALEIATLKAAK